MGGMTIIGMISLCVYFVGVLALSFLIGYSYGKVREKQKYEQEYIQKTKNLEIYYLQRGYCIACCRFDDCPKGQDNTCRGCRLYDEYCIDNALKCVN